MADALCMHAASERNADMLYATGVFVTDPVFWFKKGWRSYLFASALEMGRMKATARVTHVVDQAAATRRLRRALGRPVEPVEVFADVLRSKGITSVLVPQDFPLHTATALRKRKVRVRVRRAPFFRERMVKRDDEIAAIRTAQAAGERALAAACDDLRHARARGGYLRLNGERVTAESLRRTIDLSLARDGCVGAHTIVAIGDQCVDPHNVGSGPVRTNTSIIFDIFPRHVASGYYADMTRTVVRGKASRELREIYDVVHSGQQYAFDRIRGGCDAQAIHRGICELFAATRWKTAKVNGRNQGFFHGTGHGVGLDIHEPPSFGHRESTLPAGAVVTVEPGLYYEKIGGVRLEDMVLVTDDGCENLTGYEKQLEL
jgi:Xaa-Pro aminopeptidase